MFYLINGNVHLILVFHKTNCGGYAYVGTLPSSRYFSPDVPAPAAPCHLDILQTYMRRVDIFFYTKLPLARLMFDHAFLCS